MDYAEIDAGSPVYQYSYQYTYDARDRLATATADHLGTTDPRRLVSTYSIDDAPRTLALYNPAILPPNDPLIERPSFDYDVHGRLDVVDFPAGVGTDLDLTYDPSGNDLVSNLSWTGGIVMTDLTFRDSGPVESITVKAPSGAGELHELFYGYNQTWSVDEISEKVADVDVAPQPAYTYGYDGFDRLDAASLPGLYGQTSTESFVYDDAGNRDDPGVPGTFQYDTKRSLDGLPRKDVRLRSRRQPRDDPGRSGHRAVHARVGQHEPADEAHGSGRGRDHLHLRPLRAADREGP